MTDPNTWSPHTFYNTYYPPHDLPGGAIAGLGSGSADHRGQEDDVQHFANHRRSLTQPGSFLPPPPPHTTASISNSNPMNLPPLFQPSGGFQGNTRQDTTTATTTSAGAVPPPSPSYHVSPHTNIFSHIPLGPPGSYHYPLSSPATVSALPPINGRGPPGFSPRVPGYPSSPGLHTMSPQQSPSTHMPGAHISSSSTSSSSFPPSVPPPHTVSSLPSNTTGRTSAKQRQRDSTGTTDHSEDWEDTTVMNGQGGLGMHVKDNKSTSSSSAANRKDDEDQPWGMPQEVYKALNSRDKKQVRNRVGAKRFRAKRKKHVYELEITKQTQRAEIENLRNRLKAMAIENNELRMRLNEPPLPLPIFGSDNGSDHEGLGLVVGPSGSWTDDMTAQQTDGGAAPGSAHSHVPGSHDFGQRLNHDNDGAGVGLGIGNMA